MFLYPVVIDFFDPVPFSHNYRSKNTKSLFKEVIYYNIIIVFILADLFARLPESSFDDLRGIAHPVEETLFEDRHRRRQYEYQSTCGVLFPDPARTLNINIKYNIISCIDNFLYASFRCAVKIAVDFCPLDKLSFVDHGKEFILADKGILHILHLSRPWCPGCKRNGMQQPFKVLAGFAAKGGFSSA